MEATYVCVDMGGGQHRVKGDTEQTINDIKEMAERQLGVKITDVTDEIRPQRLAAIDPDDDDDEGDDE